MILRRLREKKCHSVSFFLITELFDISTDYAQAYPKIIWAVTHQDTDRLARQHLDKIDYASVIVGQTH